MDTPERNFSFRELQMYVRAAYSEGFSDAADALGYSEISHGPEDYIASGPAWRESGTLERLTRLKKNQ